MQKIKYSRLKLAIYGLFCGLFAWGGYWVWSNFTGSGAWFAGFMTLVMSGCLCIVLRYLLLDNTIAEIGRIEMRHHGLLGTKRIRYSEIGDVQIESSTSSGIFTSRHLTLVSLPGGFGKVRISESLLENRVGSIEAIVDQMANGSRIQADEVQHARRADPKPVPAARGGGFGRKSV